MKHVTLFKVFILNYLWWVKEYYLNKIIWLSVMLVSQEGIASGIIRVFIIKLQVLRISNISHVVYLKLNNAKSFFSESLFSKNIQCLINEKWLILDAKLQNTTQLQNTEL